MLFMQIPLVDLRAQYQTIKREVMASFEDVLEQMHLFLGPQCQAFEQEFATYCGCQYGVGLSNGTDALTLALRACGIGPGDEFEVERVDAGEYRLKRTTRRPNEGLVDLLLACPVKGWFQPMELGETTDDIKFLDFR